MRRVQFLISVGFLSLILGALTGTVVDELDPKMHVTQKTEEISREEIGCLREALYYEGRGGLVGEQIMQGMVILARVADPDPQWPKTVCGVVHQARQFSYYSDVELMSRPIYAADWGRADAIARQLVREAWVMQLLPHGAECVRSYKMRDAKLASLSPVALKQLHVSAKSLGYFARTQTPVFSVGDHTFYRDREGCKYSLPTT
jgi:hypothetical protein